MWTEADRESDKDDGRRYPSDLTDEEWALIAPLLSGYDPLRADLREIVNACLCLEKTGCPWRHLPTDFGSRPTVRTWHDRFRADGLWSELAALLTRAVRHKRGRPPEPSTGILDSQSVASGPQAGERGIDGGKKVLRPTPSSASSMTARPALSSSMQTATARGWPSSSPRWTRASRSPMRTSL